MVAFKAASCQAEVAQVENARVDASLLPAFLAAVLLISVTPGPAVALIL